MKAVLEGWMSGEVSSLSDYWIVAHNGLLHNDLGVVVSKVVVLGAVHRDSASSAERYCYTFLWKIDFSKSMTMGSIDHYSVKSRQCQSDVFRLCKVEVVYHDSGVDLAERSMLSAGPAYTEVVFVEEFVVCPQSVTVVKSKIYCENPSRFSDTKVGVSHCDGLVEADYESSDEDIAG